MSARRTPLLSLHVTEDGRIEVEPGESFGPEHAPLLSETASAVQTVLEGLLSFGMA